MADWRDTKFSPCSNWVQEEKRRNNKGGGGGIKMKGKFRNLFELDNSFYSIPFALTWSNSSSYYSCETLPQLNLFLFCLLTGNVVNLRAHHLQGKDCSILLTTSLLPLREKVNLNKAAASTNRTVTSTQRNRQWEGFAVMSYLYLLLIICWVVTMCSLYLTFYWLRALSFWVLLESFRHCSFFRSPWIFQLLCFNKIVGDYRVF